MYFPACNVAHAQEAVLRDGTPGLIPDEFYGMHARIEQQSFQMKPSGSALPAIPVRSAAHVVSQLRMLFLSSGDLRLKKVSCFHNIG